MWGGMLLFGSWIISLSAQLPDPAVEGVEEVDIGDLEGWQGRFTLLASLKSLPTADPVEVHIPGLLMKLELSMPTICPARAILGTMTSRSATVFVYL